MSTALPTVARVTAATSEAHPPALLPQPYGFDHSEEGRALCGITQSVYDDNDLHEVYPPSCT